MIVSCVLNTMTGASFNKKCVCVYVCENVLLPVNMGRDVIKLSILIINYGKLMIQIDNVITQQVRVFVRRTFSYTYSENIFMHIERFHALDKGIFVQTHSYLHAYTYTNYE